MKSLKGNVDILLASLCIVLGVAKYLREGTTAIVILGVLLGLTCISSRLKGTKGMIVGLLLDILASFGIVYLATRSIGYSLLLPSLLFWLLIATFLIRRRLVQLTGKPEFTDEPG